jgi:predicted ribosomally synthesized peptide with SipW-like signal peptide
MSGTHRAERANRLRRGQSQALLLAGALLLGATSGLGTLAYWNDVETVSGGTITAGTLDLSVEDDGGVVTGLWNDLAISSMAPGESIAATLTVRNVGSTPFTVEIFGKAAGTAGPLGGSLVNHVTANAQVGGTALPDDGGLYPRQATCSGGAGKAAALLGTSARSLATTGVVGSTAPGNSITICLQLTLPSVETPDTVQGANFEPTFTFTATQVAP